MLNKKDQPPEEYQTTLAQAITAQQLAENNLCDAKHRLNNANHRLIIMAVESKQYELLSINKVALHRYNNMSKHICR